MVKKLTKVFYKNKSGVYALARIAFGIMWLDAVWWKVKSLPDFGIAKGDGFYYWVTRAVEYPVFIPFSYFVEHVVLPNLFIFGIIVILIELILGFGYVFAKKLDYICFLSIIHTLLIMLSTLNTPHEWVWTYLFMILISLLLANIYISKNKK